MGYAVIVMRGDHTTSIDDSSDLEEAKKDYKLKVEQEKADDYWGADIYLVEVIDNIYVVSSEGEQ